MTDTPTTEPTPTPQAAPFDMAALADVIATQVKEAVKPYADAAAAQQQGGQRNFDAEAIIQERDKVKATNRDLLKQLEAATADRAAMGGRFDNRLKMRESLKTAGVIDPDTALTLINWGDAEADALKLTDGKIDGLDVVMETIKQRFPYLAPVVEEAPPEPNSPHKTIPQVPAPNGTGTGSTPADSVNIVDVNRANAKTILDKMNK